MIVTIHQPDLLPYSGFWFKMVRAHVFVLAVHDQFQKHGYQRRVKMKSSWVSHQLEGKPSLVPITSVKVRSGWQGRIIDAIRGRYTGSRHWRHRGPELLERIDALPGHSLVEVNCGLIEVVRQTLDITTPLVVTDPPEGSGTNRLIEQVHMVGGTSYLAGSGGLAYMGHDARERFADAGIDLQWSQHQHITGDSILTLMMDVDDPMEAIMRTGGRAGA